MTKSEQISLLDIPVELLQIILTKIENVVDQNNLRNTCTAFQTDIPFQMLSKLESVKIFGIDDVAQITPIKKKDSYVFTINLDWELKINKYGRAKIKTDKINKYSRNEITLDIELENKIEIDNNYLQVFYFVIFDYLQEILVFYNDSIHEIFIEKNQCYDKIRMVYINYSVDSPVKYYNFLWLTTESNLYLRHDLYEEQIKCVFKEKEQKYKNIYQIYINMNTHIFYKNLDKILPLYMIYNNSKTRIFDFDDSEIKDKNLNLDLEFYQKLDQKLNNYFFLHNRDK